MRRGTGSTQWVTALALLFVGTVTSWAPSLSCLRKARSCHNTAVAMRAVTSSTSQMTAASDHNNAAENHAVEQEPCNVVFTHTNADFDSLAAAVALSLLWKHENPSLPTHVVLPRGVHPVVQRFLAFHKHLLPLRGFKTILPEDVSISTFHLFVYRFIYVYICYFHKIFEGYYFSSFNLFAYVLCFLFETCST
jgi:hypothetical protein